MFHVKQCKTWGVFPCLFLLPWGCGELAEKKSLPCKGRWHFRKKMTEGLENPPEFTATVGAAICRPWGCAEFAAGRRAGPWSRRFCRTVGDAGPYVSYRGTVYRICRQAVYRSSPQVMNFNTPLRPHFIRTPLPKGRGKIRLTRNWW